MERVVGTLDVDAMLDDLTPQQFDEWRAYRELAADPYERLVEIVKVGFAALCNALGSKNVTPEMFDPQRKDEPEVTPQQASRIFMQHYGAK